MSFQRTFSPVNPHYTDPALLTSSPTSPTQSLSASEWTSMATPRNEANSNSNHQIIDNSNSQLNVAATSTTNASNSLASNRNSGVFLTLKLSYSPTGELVIDMEPAQANNRTSTTTVDTRSIGAAQIWVYIIVFFSF